MLNHPTNSASQIGTLREVIPMIFRSIPELNDPNAVVVYREEVPEKPASGDYARIGSKILELLHLELSGAKVVFKPNVTSGEHFADPDSGITTHPGFIGGMAKYLFEHGAKPGGIYVVEDPRDSDDFNPRHWQKTGYLEMAEEAGVKIRCPSSYYCVKKEVPDPLIHSVRNVSRYAVDPNTMLINVPKLKTHNLGITTLCMKNLMGLDDVFDRHYCGQSWKDLPADRRFDDKPKNEWMDHELHELWQLGLAKRLTDLSKVIRPALNVVEGIIGRDGTGFNRGKNYNLGLTVAGINGVAVDSVTSYIMGFDPANLVYLKVAQQAGLGESDLAKLRIYIVEDGKLASCANLQSIRAAQPFRVIRDIVGDC
jgi:uncharacterized protein (DUF362 family)